MAWYFNGNYPWVGMLFCAPDHRSVVLVTDQYIVQRVLAAPKPDEARRGTIASAYLKLLPVFIFIVPGMITLGLARSGRVAALAGFVDASGNAVRGCRKRHSRCSCMPSCRRACVVLS
jgi:SSS family solute:Na+ symporter